MTPEERQQSVAKRAASRKKIAEAASASVDALLADQNGPVPVTAQPSIKKTRRGSLQGAIELKCWDCTAWQKSEITHCELTSCPLHAFRPYQPRPQSQPEVAAA
jgi:hypothetical protein